MSTIIPYHDSILWKHSGISILKFSNCVIPFFIKSSPDSNKHSKKILKLVHPCTGDDSFLIYIVNIGNIDIRQNIIINFTDVNCKIKS